MIKNLLFLACTFTCTFIYAQCIPDTDFTGLLGLSEGAYEVDETTVLPHAILGESYETFFDMRIPTDTVIDYDLTDDGVDNPTTFDPVFISSIAVNSVQGLPSDFTYECASQDPSGNITEQNCLFSGGGYGCLRLTSPAVTSPVGTYPLTVVLDIEASYELFGFPVPVSVTDDTFLNYLVLIIEESNNTSTAEIVDARAFKHLGLYPNPAENYFTLKFGNNQVGSVEFKMYDLLGNSIYANEIQSYIGYNEMSFDCSHLVPGIYSYTLSNGTQIITKQVVIK